MMLNFCSCTPFCSFPNGGSGYGKTYPARPCFHNWVQDDSHGGGKSFGNDIGEHLRPLHGESKHARYKNTCFDADRVGTERPHRYDDQNQLGLIESDSTDWAGTVVAVEDPTSSQHLTTGAYGGGEAQREHGRRRTQRMRDDGGIQRDSTTFPDNNTRSKTLHRYAISLQYASSALCLTVVHHSIWR